jgi:hypothetical protein
LKICTISRISSQPAKLAAPLNLKSYLRNREHGLTWLLGNIGPLKAGNEIEVENLRHEWEQSNAHEHGNMNIL